MVMDSILEDVRATDNVHLGFSIGCVLFVPVAGFLEGVKRSYHLGETRTFVEDLELFIHEDILHEHGLNPSSRSECC
jgi:hypothetical protein